MKRSEFIELWLQALESGRYKQGKDVLKTITGKYCCLGVACEIANEYGVRKIEIKESVDQLLPRTLSRFLNMSDEGSFQCPVTHRGVEYSSLTGLNDLGVTFKTIARIIREQIKAKNFERYS